jgi:hypothetical protein
MGGRVGRIGVECGIGRRGGVSNVGYSCGIACTLSLEPPNVFSNALPLEKLICCDSQQNGLLSTTPNFAAVCAAFGMRWGKIGGYARCHGK